MLPIAILAGGLATRMRPTTQTIPKGLIDVDGQPFLRRQLHQLAQQGAHRVVLCVGYLADQIETEFGDGSSLGLDLQYAHDGPALLGTGGALRQALPLLGDAFFVLYGDSFLPIDFAPVEKAFFDSHRPALMTVLRNEGQWDTSNVEFSSDLVYEYNKRVPTARMDHIDYGLSVLSAKVLAQHPSGQAFDLADIYHQLSISDQLAGLEVHERFYEIGSPQGLADTISYFSTSPSA